MFKKLKETHALVWAVRHQLEADGSTFKTPNALRSLYHTRGELCEAFDLWMRETDPDEARNNEREDSFSDECADALMMLFTALGDNQFSDSMYHDAIDLFNQRYYQNNTESGFNRAFENVGIAINLLKSDQHYTTVEMVVTDTIVVIAETCPPSVDRVAFRLARIIAKNSPFLSKASALAIADGSAYMDVEMSNKIQAEKTAWIEKWNAIIGRKIQKMIDAETIRDYQNSLIR